jgi:hypothetical protein
VLPPPDAVLLLPHCGWSLHPAGYVPPAYGHQPQQQGKGKGGRGGRGGGKGKGGGKAGGKGKGTGYDDGMGTGYSGPPNGYGGAPQFDVTDEEQAFLDQMQFSDQFLAPGGSAAPPAPGGPAQEYNTYLDTNTGHQRLKGGCMEIRDPTAEELERHRQEEAAGQAYSFEEDC